MKLYEMIFPRRCPFCGRLVKEAGPCKRCEENTVELTGEVCRICGALPEDCFCRPLQPFSFERNVSAYSYKGGARSLVLRFKERGKPQLAPFMAKRIFRQIEGRLSEPIDKIVSVPNSKAAVWRRGYSPTELLARELSSLLNLPVEEPLLRLPTPQRKYQKGNRWNNVRSDYALKKEISLKGNILLIDDVVTSGASLDTCARLLKKSGAEKVFCATFAATPRKNRK